VREALDKASLRGESFSEAGNEVSLKGNKEISEAGGGVGTRAGAEGVAAIRPRCESGRSEQGCETRRARETHETSERGCARDTKKRGAAWAAHVLSL
jgi:hypothetical protein